MVEVWPVFTHLRLKERGKAVSRKVGDNVSCFAATMYQD
jgi:hypothetical protein